VGKTAAGKTFIGGYKDWEGAVSKPFKEFLCLRHRKLFIFDTVILI
jgi:hypothetical protein